MGKLSNPLTGGHTVKSPFGKGLKKHKKHHKRHCA